MSSKTSDISIIEHAGSLMDLNTTQIIIILGILIFGMATFINTYNYATSITTDIGNALNTSTIQRELWVQFGWTLGFSILMLVIAAIIFYISKSMKSNKPKTLVVGFSTLGIFGIIYAFLVRFQYTATVNITWESLKMYVSWALFILFIILGTVLAAAGGKDLTIVR